MKKTPLIIILILSVLLTGYLFFSIKKLKSDPEMKISAEADKKTETKIANPASENCLKNGGRLEIRKNKKGEYGVCLFDDNRQCEEWALLRGNCPVGGSKITGYENEAEVYCAITGGKVENLDTKTPMCRRIDGTLCTAQANFDGDCPNPNDPNPSAGNVEI